MTNVEIVRANTSPHRFIDVVGKVTLKVYSSGEITAHPHVVSEEQEILSLDELLDWVEDKKIFFKSLSRLVESWE